MVGSSVEDEVVKPVVTKKSGCPCYCSVDAVFIPILACELPETGSAVDAAKWQ